MEKYKCDMKRPGSLVEENKPDRRSCIFSKYLFSLLIFSDENNIPELVGDMRENCFNRLG